MIEGTIRLYRYFYDRLKFLRPSVASLISQASAAPEFEQLGFLHGCGDRMRSGTDFSESWSAAVEADAKALGADMAKLILPLSGVLGASDLDSQLSAIDYTVSLLESRLADAREYASQHKKLYRQLGVLAGLGIAVFIA